MYGENFCFKFDKADPVDEDLIRIVAGYTDEVEKEIAACKTSEELRSLFVGYDTEFRATLVQVKKANATQKQKLLFHMTRQDDPSDTTGIKREVQSPYAYYYSWLDEGGFIAKAS